MTCDANTSGSAEPSLAPLPLTPAENPARKLATEESGAAEAAEADGAQFLALAGCSFYRACGVNLMFAEPGSASSAP